MTRKKLKQSESEVLSFPGPAALLRKPQYLCDFQKAAYELYKEQEGCDLVPYTNPEAAYRRAFTQTFFSVFMTEAAEMESLREDFHNVFPTVKLPLRGIDAAELERAYLAAAAADADKDGPRLSKVQEARARAYNIMRDFKTYHQDACEATYRVDLWYDLIRVFFDGKHTSFRCKLKLDYYHDHYPKYGNDYEIEARTAARRKNGIVHIPLLLIEVSRYSLHEELAHKDESRLITVMSAALFQSIGYCRHLGEPFVKKLRVYGLLVGASGFEVSVMYPDFGVVESGKGAGKAFQTLSLIYRSSRKHWRFSLFDTGMKGTPGTPDIDGSEASAFNCDWAESEKHVIIPAERAVPYRFSRGRAADMVFDMSTDQEVHGYNAAQPDMEDNEGLVREEIRRVFREDARPRNVLYSDNSINWTGVGVLERLGELIHAEGERIATGLGSKMFDENHGFYFSRRLSELMPQGRTTWSLRTTKFDSEGGAYARGPRLRYWKDEKGGLWVKITKRTDGYELAVYSHPQIQSSPYFPKLRSGNLGADGRVHLTLEKITLWKEYVNKCSEQWKSEKQLRLMLAKMVLDLMSALRTLHSNGFVHADVSPNNIGFNEKAGVWQLYDFDRTMPIEESLATERSGGTSGYRSKHVEDTGIFRVFDDYIAMMQTCKCKFPMYLFKCDEDRSDFLSLFKKFSHWSEPESVSLEKCYLEVFEIFCKEREKAGAGSLLSDPTYLGALPIQKAIVDEMQ